MGVLIPGSEEEQWRRTVSRLGVALLAAFIFPIVVSGFGTTRMIFLNIELIGKGNFMTTVGLLYPLIAGGVVLWAGMNTTPPLRPLLLLVAGFFPFLTSLLNKKDFLASSIREYSGEVTVFLLIILSLIAVYVGSRILSVTDHASGRLTGGIAGVLFLAMVLLPVSGGTPPYFGLFGLLKSGARVNLPGSLLLLGLALIGIFTCYIFAALIAVLNFSYRDNSQQTADKATRLIFYATAALPISILLAVLFSGGGGGVFIAMFTTLAKMTLLLGGIIGVIIMGLLDLIDQYLPQTIKGSALLGNT
jgi:hypothetical protein